MTTKLSKPAMRVAAVTCLAGTLVAGGAGAQGLPVVKGKRVVAEVQGEVITLAEFDRQVAAMTQGQAPGGKVDREAELALLQRLVRMRLIAQEARRMEIDRLPEIRRMVDSYARVTLREELVERAIKDVKADPKRVEEIYRASVREWQVNAVFFEKEEQAKAMAADLAAGRDLLERGRAYLAEGKASKVEEGVLLGRKTADPEILKMVAGLAAGATGPVTPTKSGYLVLRVEDVRYPDDPAARADAERVALTDKRKEAVTVFDRALKKKYVTLYPEVLKTLDFEAATPGIDALLKDRRVLAEIKGEKPVTVGEMAEELKFQFFHGMELAAQRKRLNAKKEEILDAMLHRRVFRKEALRLGLEKTDAYRDKVREYEISVLLDQVVRKVVAPEVKLTEEEVRAYYDGHRAEYSTPEMVRIRSLVFADRKSAEATLESLRKGSDFQWAADHADAQVDPGAKGVLVFDGRPIVTSALPEGVRKAVAGARAGDARLYASPEQHLYVLFVQGLVPSEPVPYEQVRKEISEKILHVKLRTAMEEYADKLRSLSNVKVYLKAS